MKLCLQLVVSVMLDKNFALSLIMNTYREQLNTAVSDVLKISTSNTHLRIRTRINPDNTQRCSTATDDKREICFVDVVLQF